MAYFQGFRAEIGRFCANAPYFLWRVFTICLQHALFRKSYFSNFRAEIRQICANVPCPLWRIFFTISTRKYNAPFFLMAYFLKFSTREEGNCVLICLISYDIFLQFPRENMGSLWKSPYSLWFVFTISTRKRQIRVGKKSPPPIENVGRARVNVGTTLNMCSASSHVNSSAP